MDLSIAQFFFKTLQESNKTWKKSYSAISFLKKALSKIDF